MKANTSMPGFLTTIPLYDLLSNKALYHKKMIQTEGYYLQAFEISALYHEFQIDVWNDNKKHYDFGNGLWIDFDHKKFKYPSYESVQKRIITVKGIFDTTETGHMGIYVAGLTRAEVVAIR